jgi:glutamate dehydrogenase (NADP+)
MGGSQGRNTATGTGAFFILEAMLCKFDLDPANTSIAVQGLGNAGMVIAELLYKAGYKIVAVSDSQGGIYNEKGLDLPKIIQHKLENRADTVGAASPSAGMYCKDTVCDLEENLSITNEELLALEVDVLVPAALENQITEANAANVKAKYIFEVANGPITSAADAVLDSKGIYVFPDILVNAGGVTVSYFEWVQNRSGLYWNLTEVNEHLKQKMVIEADEVWKTAEEFAVPLRTAAYIHALNRLGEALDAKGTRDYYLNHHQG